MGVKSTGLPVKGLRSEFFKTFDEAHQAGARWPGWATTIPTEADSEDYRWLGAVPQMRVFGTGRIAKGMGVESYRVKNEKYELTLEVDRDEISDDQTGQIRIRINEMARRAATFKDKQIAALLTNGESAGFVSYDGSRFFATDHVSGKSGSQSNKLTFNISSTLGSGVRDKPDNPDAETLTAAFDACVTALMSFVDEEGEQASLGLQGLVVVTAVSNWRTWETAMNAGLVKAGGTNVQTVVPTIVPFEFLTDKSKFYVLRTGNTIRPFVFQDREPLEFNSLTEDSDEGFRREKFLYGVRARYKLAYGQWMHAISMDLQ